jgi:hypothetical protein
VVDEEAASPEQEQNHEYGHERAEPHRCPPGTVL